VLKLEVQNLSDDLAFLQPPPSSITVSVAGNLQELNAVKGMRLSAVLDLKAFDSPGSYTISPELPDIPELRGHGTVHNVRVLLANKTSTTMLIEVWHRGELPEGYMLSSEEVNPERAEIEGAEELVKRAKHIVAEVELSERTSNMSRALPLTVYSAENEVLSTGVLKVTPPVVQYRGEINPVANVKAVKVNAVIGGQPQIGYYLKELRLTPSQILFEDSLYEKHPEKQVDTEVIDLEGKSSSFTQVVKLNYGFQPPPGMPTEVSVNVVLAKFEAAEGSSVSATLALIGREEIYDYMVRPPSVIVQSTEFQQLTDEQRSELEVRVSVHGLTPGVYRIIPEVLLPGEVERAVILQDSVEVTVLEKE
jgi:YbbR domain-containing protein